MYNVNKYTFNNDFVLFPRQLTISKKTQIILIFICNQQMFTVISPFYIEDINL